MRMKAYDIVQYLKEQIESAEAAIAAMEEKVAGTENQVNLLEDEWERTQCPVVGGRLDEAYEAHAKTCAEYHKVEDRLECLRRAYKLSDDLYDDLALLESLE